MARQPSEIHSGRLAEALIADMPGDIQRTVRILAPDGSPDGKQAAAIRVAMAHHEAMGSGVANPTAKIGRRQSGR